MITDTIESYFLLLLDNCYCLSSFFFGCAHEVPYVDDYLSWDFPLGLGWDGVAGLQMLTMSCNW